MKGGREKDRGVWKQRRDSNYCKVDRKLKIVKYLFVTQPVSL